MLEVDAAAPQFEHARRRVGDDPHDHVLDLRCAAVPLIECFQDNAIVGAELDHFVGPGADWLRLVDVRVCSGRKDSDGEVVEDAGIGFLQFENDSVVVRCLDVVDGRISRSLRRHEVRIHHRVVGPLHVGGLDRLTILELRIRIEMEDDRLVVRRFPLLGDVRRVVVVGRDFDQAAVDQIEQPPGRVVRTDARIEICRRRHQRDHERVFGGSTATSAATSLFLATTADEKCNKNENE